MAVIPEVFNRVRIAMDKLGVAPAESVYIGDNPHKYLPGA